MIDQQLFSKVRQFQAYLDLEIVILEDEGVTYAIAYDFLNTLVQRVRLYLNQNAPGAPPGAFPADFPEDHREQSQRCRFDYFTQAAIILAERAKQFHPQNGSFWEDVREELLKLSEFVQELQHSEAEPASV
jgi:hypothetical protein